MVLLCPYLVIDIALAVEKKRKEKILHCKAQNHKPHTGLPQASVAKWCAGLRVTDEVAPWWFPVKKFLLDLLHFSSYPPGTELSKRKPLLISYNLVVN